MEPPSTFKVLLFLLAEAQALDNPHPGEVRMGPTVIAGQCNLPLEDVRAALASLEAIDDESQTRADKRTIEALPDGGGYRLVNFELYHPQAQAKAGWRVERAKKAAEARWSRARGSSTEQIQSAVCANNPGSLRPGAGPAADPVQGEAVATSKAVLPMATNQHGRSFVEIAPQTRSQKSNVEPLSDGNEIEIPGRFVNNLPPYRPALLARSTVIDAATGERRDSYVGDTVYPTREERRAAEREAQELARKIADGRHRLGYVDLIDPVAVIAHASSFRDSRKLRVDLMTNERLWHTINDPENGLRAGWREVEAETKAKGLEV